MAYQGGSIKSTAINGLKMYSVSGQRSTPTWLPPKKLKALRKDTDYRQRVELIQDLRFETATTKIKATPDGEFLIASGIYPPQVKVYELRELSLKFERHLDSEIIDFQVLTDDYSKIAFLCADRSVCLHAKYGSHYSLRIPRMGRDIAYDCWSCDMLCAASSPDLYRINLEQGRFLSPLNTRSPAINAVCRSTVHGLVACGGEDGAVECFDLRMKSSVGRINAVASSGDIDQEVTALQFDGSFFMAAGSSCGKESLLQPSRRTSCLPVTQCYLMTNPELAIFLSSAAHARNHLLVLIYDLRSSHPVRIKDHMYGSPILDIKWHRTLNSGRPKMITSDTHVVRVWDPETGNGMTSIEPTAGTINDVCIFGESGLMLLALDCSQIPSYFIPSLGPAPKWCSYLEHLTEELEEGGQTTIYDDFKFLTMAELEQLNLSHLIGTDKLKAYMHGYFVHMKLYQKAQALAKPFIFYDYLEKKKQEKLEQERASRITVKRKLPKVNRVLAARLLEEEEAKEGGLESKDDMADKKKASKKRKGLGSELLKDERFAVMFEDKDFEVDELSPEYLALHPVSSKKKPSLIEEHFEPVLQNEEEQGISDSDASMVPQSSDEESEEETNRVKKKSAKVPRLYEVKDERHAEAFWKNASLAKEDALPLGERVAALAEQQASGIPGDVKLGLGGSREISYLSRSSAKYKAGGKGKPWEGKRRGIQSLGIKPDRSSFRGRGKGGHGKSRRKGGW